MRKPLALINLFVLASMALVACNPAATEPAIVSTRTVAIAPTLIGDPPHNFYYYFYSMVDEEPQTLDPALAYETAGGEIIQNVYETLVFYDQVPTILLAVETSQTYEQRWIQGEILNPVFPRMYFYTIYKA